MLWGSSHAARGLTCARDVGSSSQPPGGWVVRTMTHLDFFPAAKWCASRNSSLVVGWFYLPYTIDICLPNFSNNSRVSTKRVMMTRIMLRTFWVELVHRGRVEAEVECVFGWW